MPEPKQPTWWERVTRSWATRSLVIGAVATAIDLALGSTLIVLFPTQSRLAAMVGTLVGSTFTFFANRRFAFKDEQSVSSSAWKFVVTTVVLSLLHGQAMVWLRDGAGVPYVPAKVLSDLVVFTFTQLVLFRFFVFKPKTPDAQAARSTPTSSASNQSMNRLTSSPR